MKHAITVLGAVPVDQLGIVMPHEHIACDIARHSGNQDNLLNDISLSQQELAKFKQAGGATLVDVTTGDIGRDVLALKQISETTGLNIITCTGYYTAKTAQEFIADKTADQLAQEMVHEITCGIDGTSVRPGIIGELGSANHIVQPSEQRVLRAAAHAHHETGLAISLHSAIGRPAVDQLTILHEEAMPLERVIVGHVHYQWHRQLEADLAYYQKLLDMGCYLGFDQIGWGDDYFPETEMAKRIGMLIDKGYVEQLLLSSDLCRRSFYHANGGFGYDYVITKFVKQLLDIGVLQSNIDTILVDSPARVLAF